jgi:ACS family tartrate transporter-like MFS transporter
MIVSDDTLSQGVEKRTLRRVFWRIIPLCFVLYIISYLNRAAIGYAALQMNEELGLTSQAFGFAAGIFFIGYFLFEVPSNVALARFGARIWIARILVTWGIVSVLTGFINATWQLYFLRFLLGVAEAGFFPGIIIYLTYWFRAKEQATTIAFFVAAIPVSYVLGAPLSTWLMEVMDHLGGLRGWRWMMVVEGIPAILGGVVAYFFLTDRPEEAKWLKEDERTWLIGQLAADEKRAHSTKHLSLFKAITDPGVLYLSVIYFVYQCGSLGIGYWMPQIVKGLSSALSDFEVGLVSMVPYAVATVAMVLWSKNSDRTGERKMHTALPLLVSAVALGSAVVVKDGFIGMALISIALSGLYAFKAPFWALPGLFLSRSTAAISIAAINSIGNLGGFVGPYAIGIVKDRTGNTSGGLVFLTALLVIAFLMAALARLSAKSPRPEAGKP